MVLICLYLISSKTEHLFIQLFAVVYNLSVNHLFVCFVQFLIRLFVSFTIELFEFFIYSRY